MRLPWPFTSGSDEEGKASSVDGKGGGGEQRTMTEQDNKLAMETLTRMLDPYRHGEIPVKARTDPKIPQKDAPKMTIGKAWQYIPFLASQGAVAIALLRDLGSTDKRQRWLVDESIPVAPPPRTAEAVLGDRVDLVHRSAQASGRVLAPLLNRTSPVCHSSFTRSQK